MTARILIVEDEPAIRELIALNLRHAGWTPLHAPDAASARASIDAALPDLILLDWMLPDQSGVELARRLRADARTRELPIILLTARSAEPERWGAFGAGAAPDVPTRFSAKARVARSRALLRRRAPEAGDEPVEVAGLRLEPATFRVIGDGQPLRMGPTEFRLLHHLMRNVDRVLSRGKLLDAVWGDHVFIEERTVDVHIRRLRLALQPSGHDRLVETVRGGGYRFLPQ